MTQGIRMFHISYRNILLIHGALVKIEKIYFYYLMLSYS